MFFHKKRIINNFGNEVTYHAL